MFGRQIYVFSAYRTPYRDLYSSRLRGVKEGSAGNDRTSTRVGEPVQIVLVHVTLSCFFDREAQMFPAITAVLFPSSFMIDNFEYYHSFSWNYRQQG